MSRGDWGNSMLNRVNEDAHNVRKLMREAEGITDESLMAYCKLLQAMLAARSNPDVTVGSGQAAVLRLLKAKQSVASAYGDLLRVHDELSGIAKVTAGVDEDIPTERDGGKETGEQVGTLLEAD